MEHTQQPISIEINLRPVRIGFLVDPRDRKTISDVVRIASCLWGGTMCPLIPVMETAPGPWQQQDVPSPIDSEPPPTPEAITRGHLELFEPDVLVETAPDQLRRVISMGNVSISNKRRWTLSSLVRHESSWLGPYFDVGVGMDAIYEHLHRKEYQFKRRDESLVMSFAADDRDSTSFFEVAYGVFPESELLQRFADSYRASLSAETVVPELDAWKRIESTDGRYPFSFSNYAVEVEVNYGRPTLFIFDPCAATDVIEFWNFRLFRRQVTPFNIRWASIAKDFFWNIIQRNNNPLAGDPSTRLGTDLHVARSTDIARVNRILDLTRADKPEGAMGIAGKWPLPVCQIRTVTAGARQARHAQRETRGGPGHSDLGARVRHAPPCARSYTVSRVLHRVLHAGACVGERDPATFPSREHGVRRTHAIRRTGRTHARCPHAASSAVPKLGRLGDVPQPAASKRQLTVADHAACGYRMACETGIRSPSIGRRPCRKRSHHIRRRP